MILNLNSQIIWVFVDLLILFVLMKKFLFGPITKMLDDRAQQVSDTLDQADKRLAEAELQGRAIHIGNAHRALVIVAAPAHDLHVKILHQLAELGGGALHLICHMEAPCSSVYIYSIISYRGRFYNTKNASHLPLRLLCGTRLPAP